MQPAKSEFKHIPKEKSVTIKEQNFCSLHCKTLYTQHDISKLPVIAGLLWSSVEKTGELPKYTIAHIMKVFTIEGENSVVQVSLCFGDGSDEIPLGRMFVLYHQRTLTKQLLLEFVISTNYELELFHYLQRNSEIDKIIRENYIKLALEPLLNRSECSSVYEFAAHVLNSLSAHIINLLPDTTNVCRVTPTTNSTSGMCTLIPELKVAVQQTDWHKVLLHWTVNEPEKQKTYFLIAAVDHLYLLFIECISSFKLQIVDGVTVLHDDQMEFKCTNFLSPGKKHYITLTEVQDDLLNALCNRRLLERRGLYSIVPLFHRIQYDR